MKKTVQITEKLKLSRQTLRRLHAGQVQEADSNITWPPCYPSRLDSFCQGG